MWTYAFRLPPPPLPKQCRQFIVLNKLSMDMKTTTTKKKNTEHKLIMCTNQIKSLFFQHIHSLRSVPTFKCISTSVHLLSYKFEMNHAGLNNSVIYWYIWRRNAILISDLPYPYATSLITSRGIYLLKYFRVFFYFLTCSFLRNIEVNDWLLPHFK